MPATSEHDFMKRGYLLPKGCKDLGDAAKLQQLQNICQPQSTCAKPEQPVPLPPITAEIIAAEQLSVLQLAVLLGEKPFQVIADLMRFGVYATLERQVDFDLISKVARVHGFMTKRAA